MGRMLVSRHAVPAPSLALCLGLDERRVGPGSLNRDHAAKCAPAGQRESERLRIYEVLTLKRLHPERDN